MKYLKDFKLFENNDEKENIKNLIKSGKSENIELAKYLYFEVNDKGEITDVAKQEYKDVKIENLFEFIEKVIKYEISNYTVVEEGDDYILNVNGKVNLYNKVLSKIPFQFGEVTGSFDCGDNYLTNLKGCPRKVGLHFMCNGNNEFLSLEGGPREVGGDFQVIDSNLKTLEYSPIEVGKDFCVENNLLKNLDHLPKKIGNLIALDSNQLTSLEGLVATKDNFISVFNNQLTSLKGCPDEIGGIECSRNQITSLEGGPKKITWEYYCDNNKLKNLKGAPDFATEFFCNNNELTSLVGSPKRVENNFKCKGNNIRYLTGCPEYVGGDFDIRDNPLVSVIGAGEFGRLIMD